MAARSGKFKIANGPGKWGMMLAVFHGEKVHFKWGGTEEAQWHIRRLWENLPDLTPGLEISGISFYGHMRIQCSFTTMFPSGKGSRMRVSGEYNLETRIGEIDLTCLCERGILPWPT